nr:Chain A, Transcriptional regulator, LacI family [Ruminiclostridium cellulolyticum H10]7FF4_B Chain B, Transcriptional regulator, LacI family [Ruminiclostridium cellulolyticum H10]7FF4_C Chain C, Transcriptional regulator, LacI family [Ruminiclostridium cellulolyticum H10]7FF4_D Chain D, Transcriptional regulator, LacI family [Ruminiclostridium cellulolyticum H10]
MNNIFDIARMAGVSKTTVSRVINNQPGVREETRIKVQEAIKKLNYVPNHAARSLVSRKSGVIGVVLNEFNASVYLKLANYLEKFAYNYNYNVVFCSSNDNYESKSRYVQYFTGGAADGLILFGSDTRDKELVKRILKTGFPLVLIENYFNDINVNDVIINNFSGAVNAVNYLVGLGHRKIAHITGNVNHRAALERLNGYIRALNENGLAYSKEYVINTDSGEQSGCKAADQLLKLKEPPTAVFTFNDMQGYEVIQRASELGLSVPRDLSVVGFDNIYDIFRFIPSNVRLTSMKQPMEKVAEAAIQLMVANIDNADEQPKVISFETELFHGTSCCERKHHHHHH